MIAMNKNKWCKHCQSYGHRKWLFGGTHRTHRLYLRWVIRRKLRKMRKEKKESAT